ncbi:MAG TPA: glycosyltransferase family 4 protein [Alphaproteobacteria bacterium]|nr:glycosyltransferase family 4 protein [Alphaproteobacteria bacterium]
MKLLFVNPSSLSFEVTTPENAPLGGSESCVCYLARQLANNGHDVTLAARLPEGTPEKVMGVRHRPIAAVRDRGFFDSENFDAIVLNNAAVAAPLMREISPASRIALWNHVLADQPSLQCLPQALPALDAVIFVSVWQQKQTEAAFGAVGRAFVIGNGLTPAFETMFASPADLLAAKKNRAVYTSTPFRGLRLLLDIMERRAPDMELDIFSSMKVYQAGDEEHAGLYERARRISRAHYHGSVSQSELAQRLRTAAFLSYPCIFPETCCLAALEAMAAGLKVVTTGCGALAESTMGFADILPLHPEKSEAHFIAAFADALDRNIAAFKAAPEQWADQRFAEMQEINRHCRWAVRAQEWEKMLAGVIQANPLKAGASAVNG